MSVKEIFWSIIMLRKFCYSHFFFILLCVLCFQYAYGQQHDDNSHKKFILPNSEEYQKILDNVTDYINNITTIKARFTQINHDGTSDEGTLYISRPGKMRVEYDKPNPYLLLANGYYFIFVDYKLEQFKHFDLDETPAYLLLQENFAFDNKIKVSAIWQEFGLLHIEMQDANNSNKETIELIFQNDSYNESSIILKQWIIRDNLGKPTVLTINNARYAITLDDNLFKFDRKF